MIFLLLAACVSGPGGVDFDGDGVSAATDCDDANAFVYPGAPEVPYDGIDQDCDGGDLLDRDGDGWPAPEDCDDLSAAVFPGAPDPPYDGVDADCMGGSDFDMDGDGSDSIDFGGADCDDTDPRVSATDADGDGWSTCDGDCRDGLAAVNPEAPAVCGNGLDDDCNGVPECGLMGWSDVGSVGVEIGGLTPGDRVGRALAVLEDLDGDGRSDLAIGAYQSYGGNGAVHLLTRPRDGLVTQDYALLVGSGSFGWSVASAPGGVLVGSLSGSDFEWRGAAYLFSSPLSSVSYERDATLILEGEEEGDRAGWAVAFADLGVGWITVGAVSSDAGGTESGAVYFVPMGLTGVRPLAEALRVEGATPWGRAGQTLEPTADVDGDGAGDLWIGAPGGDIGFATPGVVHLFTGLPATTVADSGVSLSGEIPRDQFGLAIAAGDANGDGIPDVLVGAPFNDFAGTDAGAAYLFLGPIDISRAAIQADLVIRGRTGYELGTSVELVDLDSDGRDDVIVGGPGASMGDGGVGVFSAGQLGAFDVLSADAVIEGTGAGRLGVAMTSGSMGGGPWPDLVVGADEALVSGASTGAAVVAWGGDGSF